MDKLAWNKLAHAVALPLIVLITIAIYSYGVLHNELLPAWDDRDNIIENSDIHELNGANVKKWFTSHYIDMYCPVKEVMYATEYAVWQNNPIGYHATSLTLHCVNVLLVFYLISLLINNRAGAYISALIFAIHPMAVESVAWASARGELLFTLFYLCALISYYKYLHHNFQIKYILLTFLCFVLSGLSKVTAVTLPVMLLLLDWYYHRKWVFWKQAIEKTPFFLVSLVLGLVVISQRSHQMPDMDLYLPYFKSVKGYLFIIYSFTFYVSKFLIPINQSAFYPHPIAHMAPLPTSYWLAPIILLLIVIFIRKYKTVRRELLFGLGFYSVAICVTLQITPIGNSIVNDRYSYLPYVGLLLCISAFYTHIKSSNLYRRIFIFLLTCWVVCLSITTTYRISLWHDGVSLFGNTSSTYPEYSDAHLALATQYLPFHNDDKAIETYYKATHAKYTNSHAYSRTGEYLVLLGQVDAASAHFNAALAMNSRSYESILGKAKIFIINNQTDSAKKYLNRLEQNKHLEKKYTFQIAIYKAAIGLLLDDYHTVVKEINNAEAISSLRIEDIAKRASAKFKVGDKEGALSDFSKLIRLSPEDPSNYFLRADLYMRMERPQDALNDYNRLIELTPDDPDIYFFIASVYHTIGNEPRAKEYMTKSQQMQKEQSKDKSPNKKPTSYTN